MRGEKRYPVYCPLAVDFDRERLDVELMALVPAFHSLGTKSTNLERYSWLALDDAGLNARVEHYVLDGAPVFVPGDVSSWWGLSLTHVPGMAQTDAGSNRLRRKHDGNWAWKPGMDIPYTRELLGGLPFTRLDTVRVLSLAPGGFGPAHADCGDDSPWEVDGIASITFMVRDGGVPMRFADPEGRLHDVNDPAFFFKDCAPHGVPQTRDRRLLLRVNGAMDPEVLHDLLRPQGAIW
jgi:hypothetical protein